MRGGVRHGELDLLDVQLGAGDDKVYVQGTSTDTRFHTNAGDEQFYVSSTAVGTPARLDGTLDDIDGNLTLDAGAGTHKLFVSDDSASTGDGTAAARAIIDEDSITGLSTGSITYTATGTFAGGVTVWTSRGDDFIALDGTRADTGKQVVSTLNTNLGNDNVVAALGSGDGFANVNLEEGNDTFGVGTNTLPLIVFGGAGSDSITTGDGNDLVLGDTATVSYLDDDGVARTVLGNAGSGDKTDGVARSVRKVAAAITGDGDSLLNGGAGSDLLLGQGGGDLLRGGSGDDGIEGGAGADSAYGDADQDDIIGGASPFHLPDGKTTADVVDEGDPILSGDAAADVVVGDNGRITRPTGGTSPDPDDPTQKQRVVTLRDKSVGGADGMFGGDDGDRLYGGKGNDVADGGAGNDWLEGGPGADSLDGADGQDSIVGGTSPTALASGEKTGDFGDDGDLLLDGGAGADFLAGDNASITPVLDNQKFVKASDSSYFRVAVLLDRLTIGAADNMRGGPGSDRMFGAAGDDTMRGGPDADFMEGDQGADSIAGDAGADDIVGGTSPDATGGTPNQASEAAAAAPDGDDSISGGSTDAIAPVPNVIRVDIEVLPPGGLLRVMIRYGPLVEPAPGQPDDDVVFGDNARIDRCQPGGVAPETWKGRDRCAWKSQTIVAYGPATARYFAPLGDSVLWQVKPTGHGGYDAIWGNDGDDQLYGQDGNDTIRGGAGDDIIGGGTPGNNSLYGDPGIDVVTGGVDRSPLKDLI